MQYFILFSIRCIPSDRFDCISITCKAYTKHGKNVTKKSRRDTKIIHIGKFLAIKISLGSGKRHLNLTL